MKSSFITKAVSALVSLTMIFTAAVPTWASEPELTVNPLNSSRMDTDKLPLNEDGSVQNIVYFGGVSVNVDEGNAAYEYTLYREGDLSEKAGVSVRSLDLMAVYGQDYELLPYNTDSIEYTGTGVSVLERTAKNAIDKAAKAGGQNSERNEKELNAVSKLLSGAVPSEENRLTDEEKSQADQIMNDSAAKAVEELSYSSTAVVSFEPGEAEKHLRFKIIDDRASEGSEGFSLILMDAENMTIFENNSLSVVINDDEPTVHSKVSFSDSFYSAENGKAVIKLKREEALYSLCEVTVATGGETAKAGEDYADLSGAVSFAPYETEKTVEIATPGSGTFRVLMSGFNACDEGAVTAANVVINNQNGNGNKDSIVRKASATIAAGETSEFGINIDGRPYTVRYTMPSTNDKDPVTGTIYDTNPIYGSDPLEVGKYYFATDTGHGGGFTYGHTFGDDPTWGGTLNSNYEFNSSVRSMGTPDSHYGKLEYYSPGWWCEGGAFAEENKLIPSIYYQFLTPDWEFKSETGDDDAFRANMEIYYTSTWNNSNSTKCITKTVQKPFSRTQSNGIMPLRFSTGDSGKDILRDDMKIRIVSYEEDDWRCPKCYMRFYGIAAMYKRYDVSVEQPTNMDFRTGDGNNTTSLPPAEVNLYSGTEQVLSKDRTFYANTNAKDTNIVISLGNSTVNNKSGIFGKVTGHTLTVGSGTKNPVTLSYPDGYIEWLMGKGAKSERESEEVNFTPDVVDSIIRKVENKENLLTIPYDKYFIQWIDESQKNIVESGSGYYQNISVKPKMEYDTATVRVVVAAGNGTGAFKDSELKTGAVVTRNAGDIIDLEGYADNEDKYYYQGYQVSRDGGAHFDTITSDQTLFIEPDVAEYTIRPVIAATDNRIEIQMTEEAKQHLNVQDLLDVSDLGNLVQKEEFEGKLILNVSQDPNETDPVKKVRPTVGKIYPVRFTCKEDGDNIYLPVITRKNKTDAFTTNIYYMDAAADVEDNILKVDVKSVRKSSLETFTVSGYLTGNYGSVRNDGLEHMMPVNGYLVSAGTGTQIDESHPGSASLTTGSDGRFVLSGIKGMSGDRITVLISNGLYDEQIADIVLTDQAGTAGDGSYAVETGLTIGYPSNTPCVTSLYYSYGRNSNNTDNSKNQVEIADDSLTVRATVKEYGREIKEAVFTVYTMDGKEGREYHATPEKDGSNVYLFTIDNMRNDLLSGERLKVRLVDSKDNTGADAGDSGTNLVYPSVDTGLLFYTANNLVKPQVFNFPNIENADTKLDIPLIGPATANTESGIMSISTLRWEGGTGYTLMFNLNLLYDSAGSYSTGDKIDKAHEFIGAVKGNTGKKDPGGAEKLIADQAGKNVDQKNLSSEKSTMDGIAGTQKGSGNNPFAGFNSKSFSVDVAFIFAFDFIYNEEVDSYVFSSGAVAVGGSFTFEKTWYYSIYGVPVFLDLNATLQADTQIYYPTSEGEEYITEHDFNEADNIYQRLTSVSALLSVMAKGTIQAGVGLCGILSVRGGVTLALQFDWQIDTGDTGEMVEMAGSIGFDAILCSMDFDVGDFKFGWGTLENETGYSFFGGLISSDGTSSSASLSAAASGKLEFRPHYYRMGSTDFSGFGKTVNFAANPESVNINVLLENASERTRPRMIPLSSDGEEMFVVFIGNHEQGNDYGNSEIDNDLNNSTLYYSVFKNNEWSEPMPVNFNGTFDTTPDIKKVGNKVIIAWADAGEPFTNDESVAKKLSKMGISIAVYDIDMGEIAYNTVLADDNAFSLSPKISAIEENNEIICSYMKRDISNVRDEKDLIDLTRIETGIAYVKYDYENNKFYDEQKVPVKDNSLVSGYDSEILSGKTGDYLISVYDTVDRNTDFDWGYNEGGMKSDIYLQIIDIDSADRSYMIPVTDDDITQSAPKLTALDGELYLTWISQGYLFNIIDLKNAIDERNRIVKKNENLKGMTVTDALIGEKLGNIDVYDLSDNSEGPWLKNLTETVDFSRSEGARTGIGPYVLTSDGKGNIYLFFTGMSSDPDSIGQEVFGARCTKGNRHSADAGLNSDDKNIEELGFEESGFGKAVQITDSGKSGKQMAIDELDLYMAENNDIHAVSNYYEQKINSEGIVEYGENRLVEIDFEPAGSLKVEEGSIAFPYTLKAGDKGQISFNVLNNGLLDAEGCHVKVTVSGGSGNSVIYDQDIEDTIKSGCTKNITVGCGDDGWTIPAGLSGASIKVEVSELGVKHGNPDSAEAELPYKAVPVISDIETEKIPAKELADAEGNYRLTAKVTNTGNKPMESSSLSIMSDNTADGKEAKLFKEVPVKALGSGESETVETDIRISPDDFSSQGRAKIKLVITQEGNEFCGYTELRSTTPIMAVINDGESVLELKGANAASQLSVTAAPCGKLAGDVKFYSADNSIAAIDSKGNIKPVGNGTTKVYAYYPKYRIGDGIEVNVSGMEEKPHKPSGGGGSGGNSGTVVTPDTPINPTNPTNPVNPDNPTQLEDNPFPDVRDDAWYKEAVDYVYANNIMKGMEDGTFSPETNTTRAQMATIIWNMEGNPAPAGTVEGFHDASGTDWFYEPVSWAASTGIVMGYDGSFHPDDVITREQMATMIYRYAQSKGLGFTGAWMFLLDFSDRDQISEWAYEAVCWMTMNDVIHGMGDGTFAPKESATRAQTAQILKNLGDAMAAYAKQQTAA